MSARLLLVDPAPRSRLPLVAALRERWTVVVPDPGEEPVRRARKERPAVVLLVVHRGELQRMQRTARILKTEAGRPPPVGLLDPRHHVRDVQALLDACGADGYLGGRTTDEQIREFARALAAGERPVERGTPAGSLLGRLLKR
jgi:DNA-binding response OmpR family regulator